MPKAILRIFSSIFHCETTAKTCASNQILREEGGGKSKFSAKGLVQGM